MSSSSSTSIAKKARTKGAADFATCLMMAKRGGFDDLRPNQQGVLPNYPTRLRTRRDTLRWGDPPPVEPAGVVCRPYRQSRDVRDGSFSPHSDQIADIAHFAFVPIGDIESFA